MGLCFVCYVCVLLRFKSLGLLFCCLGGVVVGCLFVCGFLVLVGGDSFITRLLVCWVLVLFVWFWVW